MPHPPTTHPPRPPRTGRIVREPLDPQDAPTEVFADAPIRAWGVRRAPRTTLRFARSPSVHLGVRYAPRPAPSEEAPAGPPAPGGRGWGCALVGAWVLGAAMGAAAAAAVALAWGA